MGTVPQGLKDDEFGFEGDSELLVDAGLHFGDEGFYVGGGGVGGVDDEVGMNGRDEGVADTEVLAAGGVEETAGGVAGGVLEDGAGGFLAEGLGVATLAADFVAPGTDELGVGGGQGETGGKDEGARGGDGTLAIVEMELGNGGFGHAAGTFEETDGEEGVGTAA